MAKLVKEEHGPAGKAAFTLELSPHHIGLLNLAETCVKDIEEDPTYFQNVLDDAEWSFQDVMERCFEGDDLLVMKARLQLIVGALADLRLRFQHYR